MFNSPAFSFTLPFQSDSDVPKTNGTPVKPPGTQIRFVVLNNCCSGSHSQILCRRRAGGAAARPNSSRAAGAGGSSNTMLKLYTDDSPGLRVCVALPLCSLIV